jgi:hypothetical protein
MKCVGSKFFWKRRCWWAAMIIMVGWCSLMYILNNNFQLNSRRYVETIPGSTSAFWDDRTAVATAGWTSHKGEVEPGVIIIRGKESSETICKAIQQKFLFCQMSTRSRRFSKLRIYSLSHVSFNQSTPQSNSTAQDTFPHNKDLYSNEVAHIKSSHK